MLLLVQVLLAALAALPILLSLNTLTHFVDIFVDKIAGNKRRQKCRQKCRHFYRHFCRQKCRANIFAKKDRFRCWFPVWSAILQTLMMRPVLPEGWVPSPARFSLILWWETQVCARLPVRFLFFVFRARLPVPVGARLPVLLGKGLLRETTGQPV